MTKKVNEPLRGKRVRMKNDPHSQLGYVVNKAFSLYGWWNVAWDNGKTTKVPERLLEFVPPEEDRKKPT